LMLRADPTAVDGHRPRAPPTTFHWPLVRRGRAPNAA